MKIRLLHICFLIVLSFIVVGCSKTSEPDWRTNFLVYNNYGYDITDEEVTHIEIKLGTIKFRMEREGTYKGIFSNALDAGTGLYKIADTDITEAIAVETEHGFIHAVNTGKYGKVNE